METSDKHTATGCIAGFFHLFDRHHFFTAKQRIPPSNRLLPSPVINATSSESERSLASSPVSIGNPANQLYSSPDWLPSPLAAAAAKSLPKSPIRLPALELKSGATGSPWKFWKEAPRLSLDSRATTDAKGGLHPKQIRTVPSVLTTGDRQESSTASDAAEESPHHRSPSVVVRLMGLEPFPDSSNTAKVELRRSASESRVPRELFPSRIMTPEGNNSSNISSLTKPTHSVILNNVVNDSRCSNSRNCFNSPSPSPFRALPQNRKGFYDSGDFFPEAKQKVSSFYGELENRLRMRGGYQAHSKDLEKLKQILEALQLKGILHSRKPVEQSHARRQNFIYDESPIVVMKPSRLSPSQRIKNGYSPFNATYQCRGLPRSYTATGANSPPRSSLHGRSPITSIQSTGERRSNSVMKAKQVSVETPRRLNKQVENRSPRRGRQDPTANKKSPRTLKTTAQIQKERITTIVTAEDESSITSISGSSVISTSDTERSKAEDKEGRSLLERCDKLIHSITEMAAIATQPSPVSILDSSQYKDEPLTPSPVITKRNIDFKGHSQYQSDELEDGTWSPMVSRIRIKHEVSSGDKDLLYISDIIRASHYFPECSDVFLLLEKQQFRKGSDPSELSRLQRKLIFDVINEILDRNRVLPPWSVMSHNITKPSLDKVWSEFERIQQQSMAGDIFDTVCYVLKKDLAGDVITGWGNNQVEMSEMILDIERLIFKDLITNTIREVVALESSCKLVSFMPRRRLAF